MRLGWSQPLPVAVGVKVGVTLVLAVPLRRQAGEKVAVGLLLVVAPREPVGVLVEPVGMGVAVAVIDRMAVPVSVWVADHEP